MAQKTSHRWLLTLLGWLVALILFFPILWMFITSFKTEVAAVATPPQLFFQPTLENYIAIQSRAAYLNYAFNSVVVSLGSTILALLLAVPAAYAMSFFPTKRTKGTLVWMLSTKMLPPVGVLVPIYILCRNWGLLDTRIGLIIIYTLVNLPLVVWMIYSFFKEVPKDILEADRMDGANTRQELLHVLLPLALSGIASTALLSIILSWNEAFWSLNLTTADAAPLTAFIALFSSPQGLFWAKLSAASTKSDRAYLDFWLAQSAAIGTGFDFWSREVEGQGRQGGQGRSFYAL